MVIDDVPDGGVKHGIAKKLQTFVVGRTSLGGAVCHTLVHEGELVERDVVGQDAEDAVELQVEFFVFSER